MGTRVYVGNLGFSVTNESLTQFFSQAGTVTSANVITDRMSGQSRGFGFVDMGSEAEAQEAIKQLNGQTLGDRQIVVNEAREKERPHGGGGGGGGRRFGGGGKGKGNQKKFNRNRERY